MNQENPKQIKRYLSWSSLSFIKSPPPSFLRPPLYVIFGLIAILVVYSFFAQIDSVVQYQGQILKEGTVTLSATRAGKFGYFSVLTGDQIAQDQVIGQMENGEKIKSPISGIFLRKILADHEMVTKGRGLAMLAPPSLNWFVNSRVTSDQMLLFKVGTEVTYRLSGELERDIGILHGHVKDWSGDTTQSEPNLNLVMSIEPSSEQSQWLLAHQTQIHGTAIISSLFLNRQPAALLIKKSIIGH